MSQAVVAGSARPEFKVNLNLELTIYAGVDPIDVARALFRLVNQYGLPGMFTPDHVDVIACQSVEQFFAEAPNGRRPVEILVPR